MSPAAEATTRALRVVRRSIAAQYTNYIGQEGKGAARQFQTEALRTIDRQIDAIAQQDAMAQGMRRGR